MEPNNRRQLFYLVLYVLLGMIIFGGAAIINHIYGKDTAELEYECQSLAIEKLGMCRIPDRDNLVYSKETLIVYYLGTCKQGAYECNFFNEYYNERGKMCRYIDGAMVEVAD